MVPWSRPANGCPRLHTSSEPCSITACGSGESPRHQDIIAAVRAIDNAPLQRRKKLWWTIRGGLGLYDPETLRNEAIKVGLLTTFHEQPACTQPELENASQLTLFATVGDERTTNNPAVRLTPKGIAITSRRQHGEQRA